MLILQHNGTFAAATRAIWRQYDMPWADFTIRLIGAGVGSAGLMTRKCNIQSLDQTRFCRR